MAHQEALTYKEHDVSITQSVTNGTFESEVSKNGVLMKQFADCGSRMHALILARRYVDGTKLGYGDRVSSPGGQGTVFSTEHGWAAVVLDINAHRANPPVFWARFEELMKLP